MYPLDRLKLANHIYNLLHSCRKTALFLQVSHSTVARWLKRPTRKVYNSEKRRIKTCDEIVRVLRLTTLSQPFISNVELRRLIQDLFGLSISKELIRIVLKRQGISKKKARPYIEPRGLRERTIQFLEIRDKLLQKRFVSIDETSFNKKCIIQKGYAPIGIPLRVNITKQPRINTRSAVVMINDTGELKYYTKPGSYDTLSFFEAFSKFDIQPGTVVLMDNVRFHHTQIVKEYAKKRNIFLLYTPPYSPQFNPIELVFSMVKRNFARTRDIDASFCSVERQHIRSCMKHSLEIKN